MHGGGLAHDVSILLGVGRHLGSQPRAKTSITIMRAPQRGHGQGSHAWRIGRDIRLLLWVGGRRGDIEECAGRRDVLGAVGVGEEPVVADAVEALGQHMQEKAADELVRVKPHRLPAVRTVDAIILPAERDAGGRRLRRGGGSRWRRDGCNGKDSAAPASGPANGALQ